MAGDGARDRARADLARLATARLDNDGFRWEAAARQGRGHRSPGGLEPLRDRAAYFGPQLRRERVGGDPFSRQRNHADTDWFRVQPDKDPGPAVMAIVCQLWQRLCEFNLDNASGREPAA